MKVFSYYTSIVLLSLFAVANIVVIIGGYGSIFNGISAGACILTAFYVAYKR